MPKQSYRSKAMAAARRMRKGATGFILVRLLDDKHKKTFNTDDPDPISFLFIRACRQFNRIKNTRYFKQRGSYRRSEHNEFEEDLRVSDDGSHWLNDEEFKRRYRVSRESLDRITSLIESHDVFQPRKFGRKQRPVKHQLMMLLHFLGQEGHTNASQRSEFKVGEGTTEKYRERVVEALSDLRKQYVRWPDECERIEIAKRIEEQFTLPNCVGMMDGTLLPLGIAPLCTDSADYHGRKFQYSLTVLVINDDKRKIRAYLAGYPGSTHDNRLWRNMKQNQKSHKYFGPREYVIGDTAFEPSDICVSAYKCDPGFYQDCDKQNFNSCMSTPRVIGEHTMGLWKGRTPWLRNIRMLITDEKESLEKILKYIDATVVLHNMLIEFGEDEACFDERDDDCSDIGDVTRIPERDALDLPPRLNCKC